MTIDEVVEQFQVAREQIRAAGFDVLVTTDRNLRYQQNLTG